MSRLERYLPAPDIADPALLATAAGFADAVGYLNSGTFAANMTGNTVLLGLALADRRVDLATERVVIVLAFFLGAFLGRLVFRKAGERAWVPLVLAGAGLIASELLTLNGAYLTMAIAAAMGIQATALTKARGITISTVVITSTIARLAEAAHDRLRGARSPAGQAATAPDILLATWLGYGIGALLAGTLIALSAMPLALPGLLLFLVAWRSAGRQRPT